MGTLLSGAQVKVSDDAGQAARAYFLFHGPLSEIGEWDVPCLDTGGPFGFEPAFIWPADHAWCVAKDVDPHWAGIGGDQPLIDELLKDPRLDVVQADPTADQPNYYRYDSAPADTTRELWGDRYRACFQSGRQGTR